MALVCSDDEAGLQAAIADAGLTATTIEMVVTEVANRPVGGTGARSATFVDTGIAKTEIWDPATNSFDDAASLAQGRVNASAIRLPDGRVLVLGGSAKVVRGENVDDIATAEFWASTP